MIILIGKKIMSGNVFEPIKIYRKIDNKLSYCSMINILHNNFDDNLVKKYFQVFNKFIKNNKLDTNIINSFIINNNDKLINGIKIDINKIKKKRKKEIYIFIINFINFYLEFSINRKNNIEKFYNYYKIIYNTLNFHLSSINLFIHIINYIIIIFNTIEKSKELKYQYHTKYYENKINNLINKIHKCMTTIYLFIKNNNLLDNFSTD